MKEEDIQEIKDKLNVIRYTVYVVFIILGMIIGKICNAQCPSPSMHVATITGSQRSVGFEIGHWVGEEEGRFSWFVGGEIYFLEQEYKNSLQVQDQANFYFKGMYTLLRYTGKFHLYAIASSGITDLWKPTFETGLRFVLPIKDRFAFSLEPVYSLQSSVNVRALLSIGLN